MLLFKTVFPICIANNLTFLIYKTEILEWNFSRKFTIHWIIFDNQLVSREPQLKATKSNRAGQKYLDAHILYPRCHMMIISHHSNSVDGEQTWEPSILYERQERATTCLQELVWSPATQTVQDIEIKLTSPSMHWLPKTLDCKRD